MPTDVEVCQANPASFFSFGPYAWRPFGILVQNRSNIVLYMNDGNYCDETNYRFLVPPYYQGAVLTANNEVSFKFDKNGTVGPIPALERATIFITDTFIAPGLFPFAATVRDTINSNQSNVGLISGTGVLNASFPSMNPGLYEVYGWRCVYADTGSFPGDIVNATAALSIAGGTTLDIGIVNNGGTTLNPEFYDATVQGNGFFSTSTVGPNAIFTSAALLNGVAYYILGWQISVQDTVGGAADGRVFLGELAHSGGIGEIDAGIGMNGGLTGGLRSAGSSVSREYKRPLRITPAAGGTTLQLSASWGTATANAMSVLGNIWFTTANNPNVSDRIQPKDIDVQFNPPLLIQITTTTNLIISVNPIQIPKNPMILNAAAFFAPLRF